MSEFTVAPERAASSIERGAFSGSAKEYFPIWIVNILLTIITLGIYGAWAKVRRKRYFYGNTVLAGQSFEYHARGKQIFIGRLIAFALIVVLNIANHVNPILSIAGSLVFLVLLPWFVMRSLRFNARVTSYRNVRFDFVGTTGGAFVAVLLGSMVAAVSLGLLAPFASRWLHRYIFNNLRYGDRPFATDPRIGALYKGWILPAVLTVIGLGILALVVGALISSGVAEAATSDIGSEHVAVILGIYLSAFGLLIVFAISGIFYGVAVRNIVWNSATLDARHYLVSDMSRLRYFGIVVSNLAATLLTLGLLRPWAAVREARYIAEHSGIALDGDLGEVVSSIQATGGAVSAEYLDMEGFDFGF